MTLNLYRLLATLAFALCALTGQAQQRPQTDLPTVQLRAGMHQIQAQVAATPDQRSTGLMYRREMPQHEGMLFVADFAYEQCFWMRNTLIPLSIAFIDDDGTVVNIREMQPGDERSQHCSAKPVRFALEMNAGWFARRAIKPGYKLAGPVFAPAR
jgi:uncharacterized membrane protein (UPF0127 family)